MQAVGQFAIPFAIICWVMYRRVKRTIGFQKCSVRRLSFRMGMFGVVALLLLLLAIQHPILLVGYAIGAAGGWVLARFAVQNMVLEERADGTYYRTHVWIEATVLVLLVGRILYRLAFVMTMAGGDLATAAMPVDPQTVARDPMTGAVLFVMVTYYALYNWHVIRQVKQLGQQNSER